MPVVFTLSAFFFFPFLSLCLSRRAYNALLYHCCTAAHICLCKLAYALSTLFNFLKHHLTRIIMPPDQRSMLSIISGMAAAWQHRQIGQTGGHHSIWLLGHIGQHTFGCKSESYGEAWVYFFSRVILACIQKKFTYIFLNSSYIPSLDQFLVFARHFVDWWSKTSVVCKTVIPHSKDCTWESITNNRQRTQTASALLTVEPYDLPPRQNK